MLNSSDFTVLESEVSENQENNTTTKHKTPNKTTQKTTLPGKQQTCHHRARAVARASKYLQRSDECQSDSSRNTPRIKLYSGSLYCCFGGTDNAGPYCQPSYSPTTMVFSSTHQETGRVVKRGAKGTSRGLWLNILHYDLNPQAYRMAASFETL